MRTEVLNGKEQMRGEALRRELSRNRSARFDVSREPSLRHKNPGNE